MSLPLYRILLTLILCAHFVSAEQVDQSQLLHDNDNDFHTAQTFTAGGYGDLTHVKFKIRPMYSPSSLTVDVKRVNWNGTPAGDILTSATVNGSLLKEGLNWVTFTFESPYRQHQSEELALCFNFSEPHGGYELGWFRTAYTTSNSYSRGKLFNYSDRDETYQSYSNYDTAFQTFYEPLDTSINIRPRVTLTLSQINTVVGGTIVATIKTSDSDGDKLRTVIKINNFQEALEGDGPIYTYSFKPTSVGEYTFETIVHDGLDSASDTVLLTVKNQAPSVFISLSSEEVKVGDSITVTLSMRDPEEDSLTPTLQVDSSVVPLVKSGSNYIYTYTAASTGFVTFLATADDGLLSSTATARLYVVEKITPTISMSLSADEVEIGEAVTVTLSVKNPEGEAISTTLTVDDSEVSLSEIESNLIYVFTPTSVGRVMFRARVESGSRSSVAESDLQVVGNSPPTVEVTFSRDVAILGIPFEVDLAGRDENRNDTLTANLSLNGADVKLVAGEKNWSYKMTPSSLESLVFVTTVSDGDSVVTSSATIRVVTAVSVAGRVDQSEFDDTTYSLVKDLNYTASEVECNSLLSRLLNTFTGVDLSSSIRAFASTVTEGESRSFSDPGKLSFVKVKNCMTEDTHIENDNPSFSVKMIGVPSKHTLVIATYPSSKEPLAPVGLVGKIMSFDLIKDGGGDYSNTLNIRVEVPLNHLGSPQGDLDLYRQNSDGGFEKVPVSVLKDSSSASFRLSRFSVYALAKRKADEPQLTQTATTQDLVNRNTSSGAAGGGCLLR